MAASFTISPSTVNPGLYVEIAATGTGTSWLGTTTFMVSGGTGTSVKMKRVETAAQIAYFTVYTGTVHGTLTVSNTTDSSTATLTVSSVPSFTINPASAVTGSTVVVTAQGLDTTWLTGSTMSVSGGTGASVSSITCNAATQVMTFTLKVGTATGALTLTDSVNSVTATFTVATSTYTKLSRSPNTGAVIDSAGYAQVRIAKGTQTTAVASGSATVVISANPGRLCKVLVTTVSTGAAVLFYDNSTTNSGTIIGYLPANAAVGFTDMDMPAANGITVVNVANGPAFTVSWD